MPPAGRGQQMSEFRCRGVRGGDAGLKATRDQFSNPTITDPIEDPAPLVWRATCRLLSRRCLVSQPPAGAPISSLRLFPPARHHLPHFFSCFCSPFSLGQHVAGNSSQTSYVSVFLNDLRGASGELIVVFAGPSSSSSISRWTCPSQSRVSGRLWGFLSCSLTTPLSFSLRYAKPLSRHLASHARFAR